MKKLILFSLLLLLSACSSEQTTPEQAIRDLIARGVEAGESRDTGALIDLTDKNYLDQNGYNRSQLEKLLRLQFLRNKNIFLFSKINSIEFEAEDRALVSLHLAMAGSAISDAGALAGLRARVYRFELLLVKDEEWRVIKANWHAAVAGDMR